VIERDCLALSGVFTMGGHQSSASRRPSYDVNGEGRNNHHYSLARPLSHLSGTVIISLSGAHNYNVFLDTV